MKLAEAVPALHRPWPDTLDLAPGGVHEFLIAASMQVPFPPVIRIVWDGQEQPLPLRVPARVG
ncbi:hypothetical protein [Streptomyces parvus]|uniref:hypothetical protein n=1 Tax=Streptomyces parvus TaxID=66428 RepID=UPI00382F505E